MNDFQPACSVQSFPFLYEKLVTHIIRYGPREINARTGALIALYQYGPFSFSINLSNWLLPVTGNRKLFPKSAAAELAWNLMGTQDASFIMKHCAPMWEKFLEDGPDSKAIVKAAYGYRWLTHFKRDQLKKAIAALKANPSDRRIWISAWDPAHDGLGEPNQLNVPCPVGFTLSIIHNQLHSSLVLRSSDVFVGLPYDVMGHAMLMAAVASSCGVQLGTAHFTLAHPHIYETHWNMAMDSFAPGPMTTTRVGLLQWSVADIQDAPDTYVSLYKQLASLTVWPEYHCKPEVVA